MTRPGLGLRNARSLEAEYSGPSGTHPVDALLARQSGGSTAPRWVAVNTGCATAPARRRLDPRVPVRILIDTNIWLDLAKDYRMSPVVTAIEDLVTAGMLELIMPQLVLDEFARNRDRVVENSKRSLAAYFKRVREAVAQFGEEEKRSETIRQLNEIDHKIAMKGEVSQQALSTIEKLMATGPAVVASDAAKIKVAERALAKLAPFHLSKNSVADALLLEIFAEAMTTAPDPETEFFFVTGAFPISRSRAHTHRRHGHPLQTVPSAGLIERPQEKNRVDALR